jgi:hypothetical protein
VLTTSDFDYALEERVAKALRKECIQIFGSTWDFDNAHRLARTAIEEIRKAGALSNGKR